MTPLSNYHLEFIATYARSNPIDRELYGKPIISLSEHILMSSAEPFIRTDWRLRGDEARCRTARMLLTKSQNYRYAIPSECLV